MTLDAVGRMGRGGLGGRGGRGGRVARQVVAGGQRDGLNWRANI